METQIAENQAQEEDLLAQKSVIDQEMTITNEEINNTIAQIEQYEQAILAKKDELVEAEQDEERLYAQYKDRLRAMEEAGDVTYWAILFRANSFSDLLDRLDMIQEIARADQEMMDSLASASDRIREAQESLIESQEAMEEKQLELEEQQATLEEQSAEAQKLIEEIQAEGDLLEAAEQEQEANMSSLYQQIAAAQSQYEAILAEEEAAQNEGDNGGQESDGTGSGSSSAGSEDGGSADTGAEETPDTGGESGSGEQTPSGGTSFIVPVSYSYYPALTDIATIRSAGRISSMAVSILRRIWGPRSTQRPAAPLPQLPIISGTATISPLPTMVAIQVCTFIFRPMWFPMGAM